MPEKFPWDRRCGTIPVQCRSNYECSFDLVSAWHHRRITHDSPRIPPFQSSNSRRFQSSRRCGDDAGSSPTCSSTLPLTPQLWPPSAVLNLSPAFLQLYTNARTPVCSFTSLHATDASQIQLTVREKPTAMTPARCNIPSCTDNSGSVISGIYWPHCAASVGSSGLPESSVGCSGVCAALWSWTVGLYIFIQCWCLFRLQFLKSSMVSRHHGISAVSRDSRRCSGCCKSQPQQISPIVHHGHHFFYPDSWSNYIFYTVHISHYGAVN